MSATPDTLTSSRKQTSADSSSLDDKSLRTYCRSYLSNIIVASRSVDKIAHSSSDQKDNITKDDAELKKAVNACVASAKKIKSKATQLEYQLCGNAKESEALHFFQRSQPSFCGNGRKRKFPSTNN